MKTTDWLKYYRASLIDANRGAKNSIVTGFIERSESIICEFDEIELSKFWKTNPNDKKNGKETLINEIEIAPFYITSEVEHGVRKGNSKKHFPFWIKARVNKKGILLPPEESKPPVFVRQYLGPNAGDSPTVAEMNKLDRFTEKADFNIKNWKDYWNDCEKFFSQITGKSFKEYHEDGLCQFSIAENSSDSVIQNVLKLYNVLTDKKNKTKYPLLESVLDIELAKNNQLSEVEIFLNPNHFGQMNGEFPLSESQRVAFAQFSSKYNKKAFAVNGPPGTGKTFILQSFIANVVSASVLNSKEAPLIVGSSTNNQAITNILDSMKLDDDRGILNSRWIPNVNSFGLYLSSKQKAEKGKYQCATSKSLNDFFLESLEDYSNIKGYKEFFKKNLKNYFRIDSLDHNFNVKSFLLDKIKDLKNTIDYTISIAKKKYTISELLRPNNLKNKEELIVKISNLKEAVKQNTNKKEELKEVFNQLEQRNAKFPIHVKLFPFNKFKEIRSSSFKLITNPFINEFSGFIDWDDYLKVYSKLEQVSLENIINREKLQNSLNELLVINKEISSREQVYNNFKAKWINTYSDKWNELIKKTNDEYDNLDLLRDTAAKLDISYRYELFWLCSHYREWEYIEELENKKENERKYKNKNKELGEKSYANKLRRIAKITPLYIATFHSLPKYLTYFEFEKGEKYYTELFDLMIVDEAGQVSPEIAIPSLSLTKKILAVGDVFQIEPVWNVTKDIDYFNAKKYNLIKSTADFERNSTLGFNASDGSLMKLVKNATPFTYKHQNNELEKGAYLLEHRRCLDTIAEYSKDNIYSGSLKLMGGKTYDKHDIPPLGYIHVNGNSEKHNGRSRKNIKEANAIVQWIISNKDKIEKAYSKTDKPKTIDQLLAVVTPFSAQKVIISNILKQHLCKESENLIVGTVHALQGAEREIILFSSVHDRDDKALFFDMENKFNMLNVALTRAKHSFIVIGNMGIFDPQAQTPSGRLAHALFSDESYALDESFIFNSELVYKPTLENKITRIDSLEKHRKALKRCFEVAEKEIIIFSPFLSINAINEDCVIDLIKECCDRNIKITILTDEHLDKKDGQLKSHSKRGRDAIIDTKAELVIVNGIHNKTICIDNKTLIEGSFNWLSATRDVKSAYHRNEASLITQGDMVEKEIAKIKKKFSIK